jgi:four helix bundle protein
MAEILKNKKYDLEDRTFEFAKKVMEYINKLPKTIPNNEIAKQLIRSAGSVGGNYIEANESLGKKDFAMKIRISRKESKESRYWLKLSESNKEQLEEKELLMKEATELMNIFGAILKKVG